MYIFIVNFVHLKKKPKPEDVFIKPKFKKTTNNHQSNDNKQEIFIIINISLN